MVSHLRSLPRERTRQIFPPEREVQGQDVAERRLCEERGLRAVAEVPDRGGQRHLHLHLQRRAGGTGPDRPPGGQRSELEETGEVNEVVQKERKGKKFAM